MAAVVACFAGLAFWGTRLVRLLALPGQTMLTLLPLGLVVGVAAQLLIANFLSYVIAPPHSFAFALGLQALSLLAIGARRSTRILATTPRGAPLLAAVLAGVVLVTFAARAFTEFQQDNFREHWLDAATILDGNFPVRHPFHPDEPVRYHYGTALLSAEVAWLSGASVLWAPQFVKTALVLAFLLLVFGFVCEERGAVLPALLAWTVFYLYVGLPRLLADLGAPGLAEGVFERIAAYGQHNQFFHFPSAALFVQPMAAGWPMALAVFYVLWRRQLVLDVAAAAVLVLLLAALALSATPEFATSVGGIGLYLAASGIGPCKRFAPARRVHVASMLAAAVVVACVQGGVFTDFWLTPARGAPAEYALRWPPGMVSGVDQILTLGTPAWFAHLFLSTDGLALLLPIAALAALRGPTAAKAALLAVIATAVGMSHFVSYPSGEFNTNRSLAFALHLALLLVFLCRPRDGGARAVRGGVAAVALLGCVPALFYDTIAVARVLGRDTGEPSYLFWWDDPELLAAASWVSTVTPRGARIATNDPMLLVSLSGRFAPNNTIDTHGFVQASGLPADPSHWSVTSIAQARADAVCLFRSPLFQAVDLDPAMLARELAGGGPNAALVARVLGPNAAALRGASAENAALVLNSIVLWQPRFAESVNLDLLARTPEIRLELAGARTADVPRMGNRWMYLNRAALQGIFPGGTRAHEMSRQGISDDGLARYAWYGELVNDAGVGNWISPASGEGEGRVRCLPLARLPR